MPVLDVCKHTGECAALKPVRRLACQGMEQEGVSGSSPSALRARRLGTRYRALVLLFAQADLLGRAESLAAYALGNLLDFAAGLEESSNLAVDRFARFNGGSWLCFAVGCFYAHGGH